ncbi:MAG: GGDEF domain-containing protein [Rubrivivax sp.]
MLWLVGFQMALYALAWGLIGTLLREERSPMLHWGAFMLLTGGTLLLAGARGEPRHWIFYNGANLLSLVAFAALRRGIERFLRLPSSDREQAVMLLVTCSLLALVGPSAENASWRVVLAYGTQAYVMLRTFTRAWAPLQAEFGPATRLALGIPGVLIGLMLAAMALRQLFDWAHPNEMQRASAASYLLMYYYLGGLALFNFGFMVLLTQRLVLGLRRASRRDALTGLANRLALDEAVERHWQQFRRRGRRFAMLLVDIDHFKQVNDTHGHPVGDAVLAQVGERLRRQARATDTVGRMGGEEFLIVMDEVTPEQARQSAERLRLAFEEQPVSAGALALPLRVCVGVAIAGPGDDKAEAVLERADRALYRAKAGGRNRVEADTMPA